MGTETTGVLGALLLQGSSGLPELETSEGWNSLGEIAVFNSALGAVEATLEEQDDLEDHLRNNAKFLRMLIAGGPDLHRSVDASSKDQGQLIVRILKDYNPAKLDAAAKTTRERLSLLSSSLRQQAAERLKAGEGESIATPRIDKASYLRFMEILDQTFNLGGVFVYGLDRKAIIGHTDLDHSDGAVAKGLYEFAIADTEPETVKEAIHFLIWASTAEDMHNEVFLRYLRLLAITAPELFTEEHKEAIRRKWNVLNESSLVCVKLFGIMEILDMT